ncbi:hypothetical protein OG524_13500 [Streptomyces sp. NBC_01520]|uniref:hypothetical protein n=1 Tax=Streptomyces sp. NBC_01520 TaxID=2903892 RepID=UPI0038692346
MARTAHHPPVNDLFRSARRPKRVTTFRYSSAERASAEKEGRRPVPRMKVFHTRSIESATARHYGGKNVGLEASYTETRTRTAVRDRLTRIRHLIRAGSDYGHVEVPVQQTRHAALRDAW